LEDLRSVSAQSIDLDRYRSYLVRLWREAPDAPWRCQVQCVGTGQERRFAGLAELFEFIVADAAGGGQGEDGCSETPDAAPEGRSTDSPAPETSHGTALLSKTQSL
jgi:hypothetical protein